MRKDQYIEEMKFAHYSSEYSFQRYSTNYGYDKNSRVLATSDPNNQGIVGQKTTDKNVSRTIVTEIKDPKYITK